MRTALSLLIVLWSSAILAMPYNVGVTAIGVGLVVYIGHELVRRRVKLSVQKYAVIAIVGALVGTLTELCNLRPAITITSVAVTVAVLLLILTGPPRPHDSLKT